MRLALSRLSLHSRLPLRLPPASHLSPLSHPPPHAHLRPPSRRLSGALSIPGVRRSLDELTKLDRLDSETPAAISAIWEAYHSDRPAVAAAVPPLEEFDRILARAAESPLFVFPIRREGGHFMLFSQYSPADRMFVLTYLEEYQRSPQAAQPWASVLLFDDLVATKGIPLLRSEVAEDKLTKKEAEHLILLYRRYYGNERSGYDKVWIFNHSERHFDLGAYLATCP